MKNSVLQPKILNILILGGGPTGLFVGYRLTKMNHRVTVFEKRRDYTRHNILSLQKTMDLDTWSIIPSEIKEELIGSPSYSIINELLRNKLSNVDKMMENKPYLLTSHKYYYFVLNEFELAYQKHYLLGGGKLIKPKTVDQFSHIQLTNKILTFKENNAQQQLNLDHYDLIFINDGARSFYRNLFFNITSYVKCAHPNIVYYGLDNRGKITTSYHLEQVQPFCYGCVLIYVIENKQQFCEQFNSADKTGEKNSTNNAFKLETRNAFFNRNWTNDKETLSKQNMFRMFVCDTYLYLSIMINSIDCFNVNVDKIGYHNLPTNIQLYLTFALYYYDLSDLIDLTSNRVSIKLFPLIYSSVKQSSTFMEKTPLCAKEKEQHSFASNESYQFMALCGDAMVSGNFHAGIVLNRNLTASHKICQLIDDYIDSYPKVANGLSVHFLRLLFYHTNLINEEAKNEIIHTSMLHTIHFKKLSEDKNVLYFSDVHLHMKYLFLCKNNKRSLSCKNTHQFIQFIHNYLNHPTIQSILKYLRYPCQYGLME